LQEVIKAPETAADFDLVDDICETVGAQDEADRRQIEETHHEARQYIVPSFPTSTSQPLPVF